MNDVQRVRKIIHAVGGIRDGDKMHRHLQALAKLIHNSDDVKAYMEMQGWKELHDLLLLNPHLDGFVKMAVVISINEPDVDILPILNPN